MSKARNWDRLRRNSRAGYRSQIDTFIPPRRGRRSGTSGTRRKSPPKPGPTLLKNLEVTAPDFVAWSVWKRMFGRWRCIQADPQVEWFLRVRHPEVVTGWLKAKGYQHAWHKVFPANNTESKPSTVAGVV